MEQDEMDGISMQSYRHSDIDMLPVVSMIAATNQQRYSAAGVGVDVDSINSDFKFACARIAAKFARNLPM